MSTLVMKFGGSLTANARSINRVAQVILAEALAWRRMVVVVAAMAGITDQLAQATDMAAMRNGAGYRRIVAQVRSRHLQVIEALFPVTESRAALIANIDAILHNLLEVCDRVVIQREATPRDRDMALATGEWLIMTILTHLIQQEGTAAVAINPERLIVTNDTHLNAYPFAELIDERIDRILRPVLENEIVPIIGGFIGATRSGAVTTLGRGGSDLTATLIGASLNADEIWIWTNVDGIMSADPQLVPNARVISTLTYDEVSELSYFGARVLHPRAVEPLKQANIPLRVRSPFNVDHAGTLIQGDNDGLTPPVKAVTSVDGLCVYTNQRTLDIVELLNSLRRIVGQSIDGPVIVMQSHFWSVLVFIVPTSESPSTLPTVTQRLQASLEKWEIVPVKVISLMGTPSNMEITVDTNVRPLALAYGPGDRRIFAVKPADAQTLVRQLHKYTEQANRPAFWPPR